MFLARDVTTASRSINKIADVTLSKVPAVTLGFWIIKIAATTLGETGGDTVTMSMNFGYLVGTVIFLTTLVVLVVLQILAKKFHPVVYWLTIIASTTAGTTMADFADRSLGIGYAGGSTLLLACHSASSASGMRRNAPFQSNGQHAQGRSLLLDRHHLFADAGHRARRLGRG